MLSLLMLLWVGLVATLIVGLILGYFWGKNCCQSTHDCKTSNKENTTPDVVEIDEKLDGDDYAIETLEGIGKHTGQRFREIGIATVGDVLRQLQTSQQRIETSEKLGMKASPIHEWAGMADFLRIDSMDHQFAELVHASGVLTVGDLARQNAKRLTKTMATKNKAGRQLIAPTDPIESDVAKWIETAKTMKAVIQA